MFPLAAAAYSTNSGACLHTVDKNSEIHRQISYKCDALDDTCAGYTAVLHTEQMIVISFRGTNSKEQLVPEAWDYDDFQPFLGGKVALYFYRGFYDIWINGTMKDSVNTLKNKYPKYDIYVLGHSLGGAMAALAAVTIVTTNIKPLENVHVYTFGQPRTGNEDFANAFNNLGIETYRIVHDRDPVPHAPPLDTFLNKYGDYYHHGAEVWYNNDMATDSYIQCEQFNGESDDCSDSDFYYDLTLSDHLHYFGQDVSEFGIAGCLSAFKKFLKAKKNVATLKHKPYTAKISQNKKL
uniref:Fungal lipase-like domain-containing protein n=1 Tax=Panagrolaimus sp. PS1159 TaxID=55785 RepID=A0AC35GDI2_9BILA